MGKVAGFEDGGIGFGETAAILLYVADKFPQTKLAPAPTDPRRGRFLQWLMFSRHDDRARDGRKAHGPHTEQLPIRLGRLRPRAWARSKPH